MRKAMCSLLAVCLVVIWYGSESECMAQEAEFQPGILSFQGQEYGRNDVVVTMEDMKGYYEYYIPNEDVDVKDERKYFSERYDTYPADESEYVSYMYVLGKDSIPEYCYYKVDSSSSSLAYNPHLVSMCTGEGYYFSDIYEEMDDFLKETEEKEQYIRNCYAYVMAHLDSSELSDIYYDKENGKVAVCLKNVAKREELEELEENGMLCIASDTSYQEEYAESVSSEEYKKYNTEDVDKWIETLKNDDLKIKDQIDYQKLKTVLEAMKKAYPDYSFSQLYQFAAMAENADEFINFDKGLTKFTDTLPAYRETQNPMEELEYGDSQRIALKAALQYCKKLCPDMSYQELYETSYLKQIMEDTGLTNANRNAYYSLVQSAYWSADDIKAGEGERQRGTLRRKYQESHGQGL